MALEYYLPYTTTLPAARATLDAIRALKRGRLEVKSLQEYHEMVAKREVRFPQAAEGREK